LTESQVPLRGHAVSGIILAGGRSSRLGQDKALLKIDGQPLVARTVDRLSCLSDDLLVVTNAPKRFERLALRVRLIQDEQPGRGALMGIYTGLGAARYGHALALACDMPFLSEPLLRYMVSLVEGYDVVVPCLDGLLEPLHAIYSQDCRPAMARLLEQGRHQIVAFFGDVRVRKVLAAEIDRFDPLHLSFLNINTPADWERAQALLER